MPPNVLPVEPVLAPRRRAGGREPTFPEPTEHCAAVDPETAGDIMAGQQPFVTHAVQIKLRVWDIGDIDQRVEVGPIARMSPLARMVARTGKDQGGAMTDHGTTERCPLRFRCESCGRACPGIRMAAAVDIPRSNVLPHAVPRMPSERTSTSDHAQHRGEARRPAPPASASPPITVDSNRTWVTPVVLVASALPPAHPQTLTESRPRPTSSTGADRRTSASPAPLAPIGELSRGTSTRPHQHDGHRPSALLSQPAVARHIVAAD